MTNSSLAYRPRRLRRGQLMRDMVADVTLSPSNLMLPLFVREGANLRQPVSSMPEVDQMSPDVALDTIERLADRGLRQFIFFGVTEAGKKDGVGSAASDPDNPVNTTIRAVRDRGLDVLLAADLCFCEYTDHGHCGVLHSDLDITVDNDATLPLLGEQAVVLAQSGADIIAPSGMMDGMVGAIRTALDARQLTDTSIMSYSIKFASGFYDPFRDAGEGAPQMGNRKSYQMDYRRTREWEVELDTDLSEGADMVMVKPAGPYLDIIRQVRDATAVPVAAYQVSGEYSTIHAGAAAGVVDLKAAALESCFAIRRAGADLIMTYFAPRLLDWLKPN
ncbi:MAG: porphobilinogen synthase [Gammaproteobacteria bacterium]|nr:porphobilinogen synthase [Gammaproteobacteria bacterium]